MDDVRSQDDAGYLDDGWSQGGAGYPEGHRSQGGAGYPEGHRSQGGAGYAVDSGYGDSDYVDNARYLDDLSAPERETGEDRSASAVPAVAPTAVRGRADRRRTAQRAARRRRRSTLRELPVIVVVALVIALVLKTFLVQVFVIPSGSMEQTIQIGDRVLVDKLTPWFGSKPGRGDVVVFKDPGGWLETDHGHSSDGPVLRQVKTVFSTVGLLPSDNEQDLIKRVIGVPGDTVECCDAKGRIMVNGTPVDEPYVAPGNAPSRQSFKVTVPAGRLWVMGDHRDLSADSRYHMGNPGGGTIPESNVVGRAFLIAWPLGRIGQLDSAASLSSLPVRSAAAEGVPQPGIAFRSAPGSVGLRPDPAEPPLVMGVLSVLPFLVRSRHRASASGGRSG